MSRKNEEARMILPKGWNYITILDFEVARIFQYKIEDKFIDNGDYEEYLTNKGHKLNNCEWMVHEIAGIINNNDGSYGKL